MKKKYFSLHPHSLTIKPKNDSKYLGPLNIILKLREFYTSQIVQRCTCLEERASKIDTYSWETTLYLNKPRFCSLFRFFHSNPILAMQLKGIISTHSNHSCAELTGKVVGNTFQWQKHYHQALVL